MLTISNPVHTMIIFTEFGLELKFFPIFMKNGLTCCMQINGFDHSFGMLTNDS